MKRVSYAVQDRAFAELRYSLTKNVWPFVNIKRTVAPVLGGLSPFGRIATSDLMSAISVLHRCVISYDTTLPVEEYFI